MQLSPPHLAAFALAACCACAVACSGTPVVPDEPPEVVEPAPLTPTPATSVLEPTTVMTGESRAGCPLDLPAIKMARAEVTSLLPPVVDARLRHFVTDGGAEDELAVRYEQRDERGIELGTELYRCDAAGLWLVSTGPDGRRVTFVPPLPVVPFAAASGEQSGDVSIEVDTGDALAPYRFAWDAADAGATPPLADLDAEWRSVRSVLLIDHDGQRYEWATETIWAISTLGPFAAHRVQTRSAGGVSATVVEDARSVRSGNAP